MARFVDFGVDDQPMVTAIARRETVNDDELRKKYMESVNNGEYKRDDRNIEEISSEYDGLVAQELMEFFGSDIDLAGEGSDALKNLTKNLEEIVQDDLQKSEENYEKLVEQDAKAGITQISVEDVTNVVSEDIYLVQQFEEDRKRALASLMAEEEELERIRKRESTINEPTSSSSTDSSYDRSGYSGSSYSSNGYRSTTATSTTTSTSTTHAAASAPKDDDEAMLRKMYAQGSASMRNIGQEFGERMRQNPQLFKQTFTTRRKGIKGLWDKTKAWFKSPKSKILCLIGLMFTIEVSMACLTGHFKFSGPSQALAYIAMMMSLSYVASELQASGINVNKMAIQLR